VGPILFADDNLSPLKLQHIEQLDPLLTLFDRFTGESSFNVRKMTALCINSTPELIYDLQQKGLTLLSP
jgi:hypothetical protein